MVRILCVTDYTYDQSAYQSNRIKLYINSPCFTTLTIFLEDINSTKNTMSLNDSISDLFNFLISSLLPLLLFALFRGFKESKKRRFSRINKFDDFIILLSIISASLFNTIQWYSKSSVFFLYVYGINYVVLTFLCGSCGYVALNKKSRKWILCGVILYSIMIFGLVIVGYSGLLYGDLNIGPYFSKVFTFKLYAYISQTCIENFGFDTCNILGITNYAVSWTSYILIFLIIIGHTCMSEWKLTRKTLKFILLTMLIVYPTFASGYLLNDNIYIRKIISIVNIISLTRLIDNCFGKSQTAISFYIKGYC